MARGSKFQEDLQKQLLNIDFAAEYLAAAIAENDDEFLTEALANIVKIHGASQVADETGLTRQAIYKMLSKGGNPSFKNINKLLEAIGLELTVKKKGA